jgi:3-methyladenine DNA glycosylase AlkD
MPAIPSLVAEVRAALKEAAGGHEPRTGTKFNKPGDEWVAFGLKAAVFHGVMKGLRPQIKALSLDERLDLASELLADGTGEMGHAGIDVLAFSVKELGPEHFPRLDAMLDDFRGWSHVDDVCITVMQPLLRSYRAETLALLGRWNASPNRWKRRASVVAFVRKVGESGEFTEEALSLCENLLRDPEDLVQKGVGWALKDVMRGDPERVLAYVKELRRRGVSAAITLYAIRALRGTARAAVLAVRREI